jgi:ketosteroid isomerase-like protein
MSQENVELHHRSMDVYNRRDLDAYLALMDDDVEAVPRTSAMEGESSYRGHDGIRRWWNNQLDVFPDFSIEAVEIRDSGDLTFAAIYLRGHGAGSAAPTDQAYWNVVRWRRGKCIWWRSFDTRAEALEAVGLSEQDAHADS